MFAQPLPPQNSFLNLTKIPFGVNLGNARQRNNKNSRVERSIGNEFETSIGPSPRKRQKSNYVIGPAPPKSVNYEPRPSSSGNQSGISSLNSYPTTEVANLNGVAIHRRVKVRRGPIPVYMNEGVGDNNVEQLADINERHVILKVERANHRVEREHFPHQSAYSNIEHLRAVKYQGSGIIGVFLSDRAATKVQMRWNPARNVRSNIYFNATAIIARPLTQSGSEINLGNNNGPNPNIGWIYLNDSVINSFINGKMENDLNGKKLENLYKVCEAILHCIYSEKDDVEQNGFDVCTFGSMDDL